MSKGLNLKFKLKFPIIFAKIFYGNGPFDGIFRTEESNREEWEQCPQILYLEVKPTDSNLGKRLQGQPIKVRLYRHPTGEGKTDLGEKCRGQLDIGRIEDDEDSYGFVEIFGWLSKDIFDSVASAFIVGGDQMLNRSYLQIGFKDEEDQINLERADSTLEGRQFFLLSDIAITFEAGERYDPLIQELKEQMEPKSNTPNPINEILVKINELSLLVVDLKGYILFGLVCLIAIVLILFF